MEAASLATRFLFCSCPEQFRGNTGEDCLRSIVAVVVVVVIASSPTRLVVLQPSAKFIKLFFSSNSSTLQWPFL